MEQSLRRAGHACLATKKRPPAPVGQHHLAEKQQASNEARHTAQTRLHKPTCYRCPRKPWIDGAGVSQGARGARRGTRNRAPHRAAAAAGHHLAAHRGRAHNERIDAVQIKELTSALPATLARGHATGRWFIDEMHQDLCAALAIAHDSQLRMGLNSVGAWEAGHQTRR